MLDMFDHAKVEPEEIYKKVKSIASNDVDGIFVACTQLRALEVLEMLEQDIGLPVYSAVQASAWNAFKILGISLPSIRVGKKGVNVFLIEPQD